MKPRAEPTRALVWKSRNAEAEDLVLRGTSAEGFKSRFCGLAIQNHAERFVLRRCVLRALLANSPLDIFKVSRNVVDLKTAVF